MVRFGLIGFGLFGKHHAAAIAQGLDTELVAIAVKSPASREAAAAAYPNCRIYADPAEMLEADDIDVVDVVVPNRLHFEIGRQVLESGKHLLMEKPMAVTREDCDRLVELAARRNLLLGVNHELRLSSLWGGVKQLIDDGVIGKPQYALIELSRFPYRQGSEGWRYDIERVGNWILEEPIHFFDLARWYLSQSGDPQTVYARASSRHPDHPELQDNFSAMMGYADGSYAVVSQTLAAFEHHVTAKITGTKGTIWAYWSAADARSDHPTFGLRYGLGDDVQEVQFDRMTGELLELADQIQAMAQAVEGSRELPCSGEDGRWSAVLCLAAQESVDSGQIVEL